VIETWLLSSGKVIHTIRHFSHINMEIAGFFVLESGLYLTLKEFKSMIVSNTGNLVSNEYLKTKRIL